MEKILHTSWQRSDQFSHKLGEKTVSLLESVGELKELGTIADYQKKKVSTDLRKINVLQNRFNAELGIVPDSRAKLKNYNPVLARWKYEELATDGERQAFRDNERRQLETVLRERYRAGISPWEFVFDENGKLRNKLMPDEPWEDVLERGVLYRREQGSCEQEREVQEVVGIRKVQEKFADPATPIGTHMVLISGPGLVEGSAYTDNFVDDYEKILDSTTGLPGIRATRYASSNSYDSYRAIAESVDPDYFQGEKGPLDAWFLSHPLVFGPGIFTDADDLFDTLFQRSPEALKEREMQKIIQTCVPVILYYINILCQEKYEPRKIALAFNALLTTADMAYTLIKRGEDRSVTDALRYYEKMDSSTLQEFVAFAGKMPVPRVAAGCGESIGFAVGGLMDVVSNSVGQFGLLGFSQESDEYGSLYFACPSCKKTNKRDRGALLTNCRHCGRDVRCDTHDHALKKKKDQERKKQEKRQEEERKKILLFQKEQKEKAVPKKEESFWVVLFSSKKRDSGKK